MPQPAIIWFRRDLRLADNPALQAAAEHGAVLPVYIHAPDEEMPWSPGGAQRVWLHETLKALAKCLRTLGTRLIIRRGPSADTLIELAQTIGADTVYWNRLYEPAIIQRDKAIKSALRERGLDAYSYNAALLCEPWRITTRAGAPYRVFTPFWKTLSQRRMAAPCAAPTRLSAATQSVESVGLDELGLLPRGGWDKGLRARWSPGENGAHEALEAFLGGTLKNYGQARDRPAAAGTSRLSPHLHFGEIGPRQVWHRIHEWLATGSAGDRPQADRFLSEIAWREFAHHLLYHYPQTPEQSLDPRFRHFPWDRDEDTRKAWQAGRTGIPMVDAGMRELWATGWMHNRLRMVVASFLTKNLRLPWQQGARWFWDTLVDADLANNTLGWQWAAGCGADAAPYFRIFNPVRQGQRFDPDGCYIRAWIPELAALPDRHIHTPWQAPADVLSKAGIRLGSDYPRPLVDLQKSRKEALAAFQTIKTNDGGRA